MDFKLFKCMDEMDKLILNIKSVKTDKTDIPMQIVNRSTKMVFLWQGSENVCFSKLNSKVKFKYYSNN